MWENYLMCKKKNKNKHKNTKTPVVLSQMEKLTLSSAVTSLVGIIVALIVHFVWINFSWYWFTFAIVAWETPICFCWFKAYAGNKGNYTKEQHTLAIINTIKNITYWWLLDCLYMAIFNQWKVWIFIFGGIILIRNLYVLTVAFLKNYDKGPFFSVAMLIELLLAVAITIYLIYLMPDTNNLQTIVTAIVSAVYGGLFALVGVAWTIKSSTNKHAEDERKKLIPYVRLTSVEEAEGAVCTNFGSGLDLHKQTDLEKLINNQFYSYRISNFPIKNLSKDCIIIESIIVDDIEHIFYGDKLIESGKSIWIKTTEHSFINACNKIKCIQLKCKDLLHNDYLLNCSFECLSPSNPSFMETEIAGQKYTGWIVEYWINKIDLPEYLENNKGGKSIKI